MRAAQVKAALSVNRELIQLYWHIGREILRAQKAEGWGTKVVQRLAKDMAAEFPELGGFSRANLLRMRNFYDTWKPVEMMPQPVAQFEVTPPEPLAQLSWSSNIILIEKVKIPPRACGMRAKRWRTGGAGRC